MPRHDDGRKVVPKERPVERHASSNGHDEKRKNRKLLHAHGKSFEELVKIGLRTAPPKKEKGH